MSTRAARASHPDPIKVERPALGTSVVLVAFANAACSPGHAEYAIESAFQEIYRLEALLSSFRDSSDIGRLNVDFA